MVSLEQDEGLGQPGFTVARASAAPPDRRHPLAQTQIEPLHNRRVDLPAKSRQDLIHRCFGAEYDPVV